MNISINFAALVMVYFLIVYLIAIRRKGQKLLPWLFLILAQAASVSYFNLLCSYAKGIPLISMYSETIIMAIVGGALAAVNLLLILLVNLAFIQKGGNEAAQADFHIDVSDIPEINHSEVTAATNPAPQNPILAEKDVPFPFSTGQTSVGTAADEEDIFISIQGLIEEGQTEEATKYLRMVLMFEKNTEAIQKAERMLAEIQLREKVQS